MSKPQNTAVRTFLTSGRLYGNTNAHQVLQDRRISAGVLYDAAITALSAHQLTQAISGNQAQQLATMVANQLGIQRGPLNSRCRIAVVGKAANAWNNHLNHDFGLPKPYAGQPVTTIATFANSDRLHQPPITINQNEKPTLYFPGLSPIRLITCRPLPDDQPTYASVSIHGKQVQVTLTYRIPQPELQPDGASQPYAVLGVDPGIIDLVATSARLSHQGVAQQKLQASIKQAVQIKQAMVRKAMQQAHAGYRPILDKNNHQLQTPKGTPRRHLHWIKGKPTKEYRRTQQCLSSLLRQRQHRAYRRQVAASIVQHCIAGGIQLIALEKLNIGGMTKTASGTIAHPGRQVTQKRGLNHRILQQGWAELTEYVSYKARHHGIRLIQVNAKGTSQTCSTCGHRDTKSRAGKRFHCTGCSYDADADHNAAANIGDRGTYYYYVKQKGVTLDDVRQTRLALQGGDSPKWQQPATGLGPSSSTNPTG